MSGLFEEKGVRFQYPENWELEKADDDESQVQVTVNSPDTAFWSLSMYPGQRDVASLAEEVLTAMQAEYPQLENDPYREQIGTTPVIGYDLNFYYLDLTNTAIVRVFHHGESTCLVLAQAEDHEMPTAEPVFHAMLHSLLSG